MYFDVKLSDITVSHL